MPKRQGEEESEWISRKEEILALYVEQDKPLSEVIHAMAKQGFIRTKPQYERSFKRWRVSKNVRKEEWHFILDRLDERKCPTNVKVRGVVISQARLERQRLRRRDTAFDICKSRLHPQSRSRTPPDVQISTPPPTIKEDYAELDGQRERERERDEQLEEGASATCSSQEPLLQIQEDGCALSPIVTGANVAVVHGAFDKTSTERLLEATGTPPQSSFPISVTTLRSHSDVSYGYMGPAMLVSEHELPDEIPLDERCLPCFIRNEATESLLRQGYQCLSDITYGYTPPKGVLYDVMRASATTGDLVLLRRLLLITNSDANLKRVAANLLHDACKEGNKYLVAMLLEVGVNVNAVRSFGYSTHSFAPHRAFNALQFAVHVGRNNLIDVLINRGATIFTGEQHLDFDFLSQVIAQDTVNFVKPLLAKAATSDTNTAHKGVPVLIFVVNQSYDKMINLLTETGFNPFSCLYEKRLPTGEIHFQSAFGNALRTGKVRYLEKFLKFPHRGLDKERSQERLRQLTIAYFFACSSENLGLEKAILDTGWRPDDGNLVMEYDYMRKHLYGALAAAVKHGDCTKVDSLIQMGTSPNIPQDLDVTSFTSYTRTPLQWAMKGANVPIVRQLVAAGADVNVLSSWINKTPLQEAVSMRNLEMVSLLIEAGADVNARPRSYGQSAVETAAENGNLEMVTYLLESGADIQRPQNTNYRRTLYRAQRAGHNAVVDLLQEWKRYKYGEQDCDTIDNIKSSMTCEELCIPTESDRADG